MDREKWIERRGVERRKENHQHAATPVINFSRRHRWARFYENGGVR